MLPEHFDSPYPIRWIVSAALWNRTSNLPALFSDEVKDTVATVPARSPRYVADRSDLAATAELLVLPATRCRRGSCRVALATVHRHYLPVHAEHSDVCRIRTEELGDDCRQRRCAVEALVSAVLVLLGQTVLRVCVVVLLGFEVVRNDGSRCHCRLLGLVKKQRYQRVSVSGLPPVEGIGSIP